MGAFFLGFRAGLIGGSSSSETFAASTFSVFFEGAFLAFLVGLGVVSVDSALLSRFRPVLAFISVVRSGIQ